MDMFVVPPWPLERQWVSLLCLGPITHHQNKLIRENIWNVYNWHPNGPIKGINCTNLGAKWPLKVIATGKKTPAIAMGKPDFANRIVRIKLLQWWRFRTLRCAVVIFEKDEVYVFHANLFSVVILIILRYNLKAVSKLNLSTWPSHCLTTIGESFDLFMSQLQVRLGLN